MGGIKQLDLVGRKRVYKIPPQKEKIMKIRIATMMAALVAIAVLVGCASVPKVGVPGAKGEAKKALTEATVEVLECKMEKTEVDNPDALSNLKVTGKAIYHPAKVGAKAFKDYTLDSKVEFYDAQGRKLPFHIGMGDCGEYGKAENVVPNEPFPFKGETGAAYIGMDNFTKAVSCKVTYVKLF